MKRFQALIIVSAALLALSACSGGGRGRVLGIQCPLSYKPVEMGIDAGQKIGLDQDLPTGEYKYDGAEFYYVDPQGDTRISIQDVRLGADQFKSRIGCARNIRMGEPNLTLYTLGVSAMKIEANHKITTFEARRIGFVIEDGKVHAYTSAVTPEEKPESPSKVYEEGAAGESFVFKPNPDSDDRLEIRSSGNTEDGGTYTLVVRFVKVPPPVEQGN